MGQYLKGNNMAPIKSIMADLMRMRKLLMLITSVRVEIQLNLYELWEISRLLKKKPLKLQVMGDGRR